MFSLLKDSKIGRALKIIKLIEKRLGEHTQSRLFYLETYHNGREQGFALKCCSDKFKSYAFSEHRRSDHIIVYESYKMYQDGNVPTDEEYKNAKTFETEQAAANYILNDLGIVTS